MPVDSTALATLADLKTFLAITATTDDDMLSAMINRASGDIESAVDRRFAAFSTTVYADGDGESATFYVPSSFFPLISVGTLYDDTGSPKTWDSNTIVDSDYYQVYPEEGKIVRTDSVFKRGRRNVRADVRVGMETVPYDIQKECIRLAAIDFYNSPVGQGRLGRTSEARPGGQGTTSFDVNAAQVSPSLVKRYRRFAL